MRPDIRLIAVDLDGTLLNDRKEVPPDFIPMVEALFPRGIRFVIASGRQYFNLAAMFSSIADKLFSRRQERRGAGLPVLRLDQRSVRTV